MIYLWWRRRLLTSLSRQLEVRTVIVHTKGEPFNADDLDPISTTLFLWLSIFFSLFLESAWVPAPPMRRRAAMPPASEAAAAGGGCAPRRGSCLAGLRLPLSSSLMSNKLIGRLRATFLPRCESIKPATVVKLTLVVEFQGTASASVLKYFAECHYFHLGRI